MWAPTLTDRSRPLYRAIADALAVDIQEGVLDAGARLPTQRDLAHALGLTVTTVTRGYAEAERRGLITSHVGRGTFVRQFPTTPPAHQRGKPAAVEMSVNAMLPREHAAELCAPLDGLAARTGFDRLMGYQPSAGSERQRAAGAAWLGRRGVDAMPDRVVLTAGAQHAMAVVFATVARRGDLIVTEEVTYSGMKALASHLGLRVRGLAMDTDGLRPDAFEAACRAGACALYTMPTLQNPTGIVMPAARRQEIAAIAARHGVAVVEDDSYGFFLDAPAPLAAEAAGPVYYLSSLSKSIVPGVRIGYVRVPDGMAERLEAAVFASMVMASPLTAELASGWIEEGVADRVVAWKRRELQARRGMAERALPAGLLAATPAMSPHLWLPLPEPWRAPDFVAQAAARGVAVSASEEFIVGRAEAPHAIRLCLGMPTRAELARGCAIVGEMLASAPEPRGSAV